MSPERRITNESELEPFLDEALRPVIADFVKEHLEVIVRDFNDQTATVDLKLTQGQVGFLLNLIEDGNQLTVKLRKKSY